MLHHILFLWSMANVIQCATLTALNFTRSATAPAVTSIDSRVVTSKTSQALTVATSIATCKPQCNVTMGIPIGLYTWWPYISFSETITAATVVVMINTAKNTTATSTVFNELPSGYTLPPRNAAGTQVQTVYYTRSGTQLSTEVAFPSAFLALPDYYSWRGILETSGTCQTVSSGWSTVPFTTSFQKTPTFRPTADLEGIGYWPSFSGMQGLGDYQPSEMAWQHCISTPPIGPLIPKMTARFMTDTVTQFEAVTTPSVPIETPKAPGPSNVVGSQPVQIVPGTSKAQSPSNVHISLGSSDNTPHTPSSQSSLGTVVPERSKTLLASKATSNLCTSKSPLHTEHAQSLEKPEEPMTHRYESTVTAIHARPTAMPSIIIGSSTVVLSFSPTQTGLLLPNGGTLLPASATEVDGRMYSLAPSGTIAVINGNTISIPAPSEFPAIAASVGAFSIIPVTVPGSAIVLPGGITLFPGSVATIDGTVISLEPAASAIVIGESTIPLPVTRYSNDPAKTQGNGLVSPSDIEKFSDSSVNMHGAVTFPKASEAVPMVNGTIHSTSGFKVPDTSSLLFSSEASGSSTGTSLVSGVEPSTRPETTGNTGSRPRLSTWTKLLSSAFCSIFMLL